MKFFNTLIAVGLLSFGSVASAATIPPPVVIDFGTGTTTGGSFVESGGDVTGTDISIGALNIGNATTGTANGSFVVTNGTLNFDTAAETLSIVGGVVALGIADGTTLFEGNVTSFTFTPTTYTDIFVGNGAGVAGGDLLAAMGESQGAFTYVAFSLESNFASGLLSTDLQATQTSRGVPEVPVPAAVWLMGSGLLGLVGVARRKV